MYFQAEDGSDVVYIHTSNNSGTFSSRLVGEKYSAQKVCSTMFFTYDQYNLLKKGN